MEDTVVGSAMLFFFAMLFILVICLLIVGVKRHSVYIRKQGTVFSRFVDSMKEQRESWFKYCGLGLYMAFNKAYIEAREHGEWKVCMYVYIYIFTYVHIYVFLESILHIRSILLYKKQAIPDDLQLSTYTYWCHHFEHMTPTEVCPWVWQSQSTALAVSFSSIFIRDCLGYDALG
jgi:hypothetical protein